jgi:hypothetical protein
MDATEDATVSIFRRRTLPVVILGLAAGLTARGAATETVELPVTPLQALTHEKEPDPDALRERVAS